MNYCYVRQPVTTDITYKDELSQGPDIVIDKTQADSDSTYEDTSFTAQFKVLVS